MKTSIMKIALLAFLVIGCGGENRAVLTGTTQQPPVPTATLTLDFLLARTLAPAVTDLDFIGTDAQDQTVFQETRPKTAQVILVVPISLRTLTIRHLINGIEVARSVVMVELVAGQNLTILDPDQGTPTYQTLKQDILINADIWDPEPKMLSAGLGFTDILGVEGLTSNDLVTSEQVVRAAGGAWNTPDCSTTGATPSLGAYTSAASPSAMAFGFGYPVVGGSGLPVVFSWPVRPSTVDATDFVVIMNDGSRITPEVASLNPNFDFNERAVVVLAGPFGNRLAPGNPDARFPERVEVVPDPTPLQLIGPSGQIVSAVGIGVDSGSSYAEDGVPPDERPGPRLVAAKLNRMSAVGDDAPQLFAGSSPNDGITLYGSDAQYRLRVYTSGGFSPDGVRGMFPTEYSRYFRIQVRNDAGETVLLNEAGVDYSIDGNTVRVVGLAELGGVATAYDDCYNEDQDNQIDIILSGDEAAVRKITQVEVPSLPPYSPLYNPGGPGNNPTPGVRYSSPSPPHTVPVLQAIDDPLTVTFIDLR
jgi:hypothetical protein